MRAVYFVAVHLFVSFFLHNLSVPFQEGGLSAGWVGKLVQVAYALH